MSDVCKNNTLNYSYNLTKNFQENNNIFIPISNYAQSQIFLDKQKNYIKISRVNEEINTTIIYSILNVLNFFLNSRTRTLLDKQKNKPEFQTFTIKLKGIDTLLLKNYYKKYNYQMPPEIIFQYKLSNNNVELIFNDFCLALLLNYVNMLLKTFVNTEINIDSDPENLLETLICKILTVTTNDYKKAMNTGILDDKNIYNPFSAIYCFLEKKLKEQEKTLPQFFFLTFPEISLETKNAIDKNSVEYKIYKNFPIISKIT